MVQHFCWGTPILIYIDRSMRKRQAFPLQVLSTWPFKLWSHWGRVTHICISKLTIIGSDNGLSPGRCQAIILTNAGILLIGALGTNIREIVIKTCTFSYEENAFENVVWKKAAILSRPRCLNPSNACPLYVQAENLAILLPVPDQFQQIYFIHNSNQKRNMLEFSASCNLGKFCSDHHCKLDDNMPYFVKFQLLGEKLNWMVWVWHGILVLITLIASDWMPGVNLWTLLWLAPPGPITGEIIWACVNI